MKRLRAVLWGLLVVCGAPHAQPWSDIITAPRAIDWSQAGAGAIASRTTVCSTLNPGATVAAINSAIAACPPDQVVKLTAGTYNLTSGIRIARSSVTLRGAGADQTLLKFTGATSCMVGSTDLCLSDGSDGLYPINPARSATWSGPYARGTTSITLSTTSGLQAGDLLALDQLDDGNTDTGNLWICSTANVCSSEGDSGLRRPNRSQSQFVVVTGVSGNTVNFTPGLYMPNWRADRSPGAWWANARPVSGVGVEDLSLDHSASGQMSGMFVTNARHWWVKGIRSVFANRAAVWSYGSAHGTIRDSYFYGTLVGESQSYGIETGLSSDLLVENNIFQHIAIGMPSGESATGTVYGYNYSIDNFYVSGGNTGWMQGCCYQHSSGLTYHLWEGNDGQGLTADQIHGTSNFGTAFRNRFVGWEQGKSAQTIPVHIYSWNRYFNAIGNVLGSDGYHTAYEGYPTGATQSGPSSVANKAIFMLGWSGNQTKFSTMNNDLLVRSTLMRWGNYDTVGDAAKFVSGEVPSGLSMYANAVPGSQSLPPSFYLSGRPSWWGTMPWPAFGPDVSGGNVSGTGGTAHKIPARLCFENVMGGTFGGGIRPFNAAACYADGPAPPPTTTPKPPSSVTVTP